MEPKKEFVYELKSPLQYAKDGEMKDGKTLTVSAPTNRVMKQVAFIEQEYEKSQIQMMANFKHAVGEQGFSDILKNRGPGEGSEESSQVNTSESVIKSIMAGGGDIVKCYESLKEILLSGTAQRPTCVADDTVRMTGEMYSDISSLDCKFLLGEYIVNFIIASQGD